MQLEQYDLSSADANMIMMAKDEKTKKLTHLEGSLSNENETLEKLKKFS